MTLAQMHQLFNRLDAAVTHHRKAHASGRYFADAPDEALWAAHDKILVGFVPEIRDRGAQP